MGSKIREIIRMRVNVLRIERKIRLPLERGGFVRRYIRIEKNIPIRKKVISQKVLPEVLIINVPIILLFFENIKNILSAGKFGKNSLHILNRRKIFFHSHVFKHEFNFGIYTLNMIENININKKQG